MSLTDVNGLQDLREVIESYNDLASRLQESQAALQQEVTLLREELAEKNRQLARKNRLEILGEVAAGVAHEIRNPLGGIDLYAGLIAREAGENPKVADYSARIRQATRELSSIVGDILDFTRPIDPDRRPVSLADVAEVAVDLASTKLEESGVEVDLRRGGEDVVAADSGLLQRAFLNVILNAAAVMEDGGALTIRTGAGELDGAPARSISFADEGPGIDDEDLPKVFDPFFTKRERGTGLGLAMVSRIVAAHGGRVEARNREGRGAVFEFSLPVQERQSEEV